MKSRTWKRRRSVRVLLPLAIALIALGAGAAGVNAATDLSSSPILSGHPPVALPASASGPEAVDALGALLPEVAKAYSWTTQQLADRLSQDESLNVDKNGYLFYKDAAPTASALAAAKSTAAPGAAAQAMAPLTDTFNLHSLPGAAHSIYLDFVGYTMHANVWTDALNGGKDIVAPPYDTDGNPASFSDAELTAIQQAWQRVAEDYAPFNVDVTTQYMGESYLTRSSSSDNLYGMRVLISPISSYMGAFGGNSGYAFVGVFNSVGDYYKPALVFPENLNGNEKYVGEAASHENGHTLGLSHQGTTSVEYYDGQGSGVAGWAPIMGDGYYQNLTQWSKGEYSGANNKEDEIAVMGTYGAPVRTDDVANTTATATYLGATGNLTASGIISTSTDVDVFRVTWGAGRLSVMATPALLGPNLDILLELLDSAGNVIASDNPADQITAGVSTMVAQGTNYIRVRGTGRGSPLVDGYSSYGSLGAYSISVSNAAGPPAMPTGVTATAISSTAIRLAWTDNATDETGYYIKRWNVETGTWDLVATWDTIASTAANATSYTDAGCSPFTSYYYYVGSYNGAGVSWSDAYVYAETLSGPAPTILAVVPSSGPKAGGNTAAITGSHFTGATQVRFGSISVAFSVFGDGHISILSVPAGTGAVDVTVTTPAGTSATSSYDRYTYLATPTITSVNPTSGSTAGGTSVIITGANLLEASAVTFGGTAATTYAVNSATQITATAPAHAAGTVDVVVTTAGGSSATAGTGNDFTYTAPVTSTRYDQTNPNIVKTGTWTDYPATAAYLGSYGRSSTSGASATIWFTGTKIAWVGMKGSTPGIVDVYLDGVKKTTLDLFASPAVYQATLWTSDPLTDGPHHMDLVRNSTSLSTEYTILDAVDIWGNIIAGPPSITSLSPTSGSTLGGTSVTINGTGFSGLSGPSAVAFGGVNATSYTVNSSTKITATAPAHAAGTVRVQVITAGGTTPDSAGDDFTYSVAPPTTRTDLKKTTTVTTPGSIWSGTWSSYTSTSSYSGGYMRSSTAGAYVVVSFKGTQLDWIAMKGPSTGIADVYVDGSATKVATVDLRATSASYQQNVWSTGTLPDGYHTVKIVRSSASASGKYLTIDAVDIAGTLVPTTRTEENATLAQSLFLWNPAFGSWTTGTTTSASGGTYRYINTAGASVTIAFTGSSIVLIAKKAPSYGNLTVTLDGVAKTVSLYSSTTAYKKTVYSSGFLTPGNHTLVITRAGTKSSSSTGYTIDIDAIDVIGELR
jgi:IPT/TIG domain